MSGASALERKFYSLSPRRRFEFVQETVCGVGAPSEAVAVERMRRFSVVSTNNVTAWWVPTTTIQRGGHQQRYSVVGTNNDASAWWVPTTIQRDGYQRRRFSMVGTNKCGGAIPVKGWRRSGPRSGNGGVASPGLGTETASQVSHAGGTESSTARMVRYGTLAKHEKPAAQCRSKLITI